MRSSCTTRVQVEKREFALWLGKIGPCVIKHIALLQSFVQLRKSHDINQAVKKSSSEGISAEGKKPQTSVTTTSSIRARGSGAMPGASPSAPQAPHPFTASDFKGAAQSLLYEYQQNGAQGQLVVSIREMQNSTIPNCPPVNSTCLNCCYYGKDIEIANINTTEGCRCCSFPPANILLSAKYYPSQYRNNSHGGQYPVIRGFAGGCPANKNRAGEGGKTHEWKG